MVTDTAPEVRLRYEERLRALSPAEKAEIVAGLTSGVRALAVAGIRQRYPRAGEDEVRRRLAALLYGRDAAIRLFGRIPDDAA